MKTLHTILVVSLAGAGMMIAGCEHAEDREVASSSGTTVVRTAPARASDHDRVGVTSAQPGSVGTVVERLAHARCDREQTCDNVGAGKKYASRQTCMEEQRAAIGNDLDPYHCPGGLDGAAINECQSAVVGEECGAHPIEAITRLEKCRSGAICRK